MSGLPGLRGSDHIGITVPDLEEATRFLVDVIGCERFFDLGPLRAEDDWMRRHLNVDPGAKARIRFFRCGHGINLEIFEYESPDQRRIVPRNSDWGGHHIALYVDDFSAALAHLERHGVELLGAPTVRTEGPNAGQTWIYFLAPWGLQFELVSYPRGKGYEQTTSARLWHSADPAR
jgi:catechol 2,3-dioxygenase-like lactoylglutathione lyase family enzyme